MSRTVTLRLDDPVYRMFRVMAERENRPLSNFIETAAKRFVEEHGIADEYEMAEIRGNVGIEPQPEARRRGRPEKAGPFCLSSKSSKRPNFRRRWRNSPSRSCRSSRGNSARKSIRSFAGSLTSGRTSRNCTTTHPRLGGIAWGVIGCSI